MGPRRDYHDRARRHLHDPSAVGLVSNGRLDPTVFATHRFALGDTMAAYDTFADAANTNALKVVLEADGSQSPSDERVLAGAAVS